MPRMYYTLLTRERGERRWSIEFGDWSKAAVLDEVRELGATKGGPLTFKIIKTAGDQASIEAAWAEENTKLA